MTLALVDIDPVFRKKIAASIQRSFPNAVILQYENGRTALQSLQTHEFDALLCGLVLPELDGIALLEEIQYLRQHPHVIVLTQVVNEILLARTLVLGADYYMLKPVNPALVCKRLAELLENPEEEQVVDEQPPRSCAQLLDSIGLSTHLSGYNYLVKAVSMLQSDASLLENVTTRLYPTLAQRFDKSACVIERSIRYAIDMIYTRNSPDELAERLQIDRAQCRRRPGNRAFLALLMRQSNRQ